MSVRSDRADSIPEELQAPNFQRLVTRRLIALFDDGLHVIFRNFGRFGYGIISTGIYSFLALRLLFDSLCGNRHGFSRNRRLPHRSSAPPRCVIWMTRLVLSRSSSAPTKSHLSRSPTFLMRSSVMCNVNPKELQTERKNILALQSVDVSGGHAACVSRSKR